MSEWREVEFSQVLVDENISYGIVQPGHHIEENSIPIIRVQNIKNGKIDITDIKKVAKSIEENYKRTKLNGGELLITVVGAIGECAIVPKELTGWNVARAVSVARIKNEYDINFIKYLFSTEEIKFQMYGKTNDTVQPTLNLKELKTLKLTIPPLSEQKTIAEVLCSLDDKIDLLHRQNKTLEQMAETLFRQWFVEEAELITIKLGDIIEIYDNKRVPLSKTVRDKMKDGILYPYYGAATIMDYINGYIFEGEYLLFGEDGTVQTNEGYPILQLATGKYWVNNHTHVLKTKEPFTNFLLYIILKQTPISHIITGAVQPKINQGNLNSLKIDVPNALLIKKTVQSTNNLWIKIQLNNSQIRTLEKLRDTLLPKLMSGEVRVEL